ncbi:MAG: glycosyltransferase family 1 protein [Anaerolineae bacterium]
MHIGIDTRLTAYRTGGISTYMRRLITALEVLDLQNTYTIFQSRKAHERAPTRFNQATLWTPCHHRFERYALSVELVRHNLDLLHSPDFIPPMRGAKKHIITVHDLTFLHYPEYLTADSRHYYNDQIQVAVSQADHILVDSNATKSDLIDLLGVNPDKTTVHMLGVDESFTVLETTFLESMRRKLRLPESYILFVGTIEPRKNVRGLLKAYHQLLKRMPTIPPLLLVGRRGWLSDDTVQIIETLRSDEKVIWRENIADEQLPTVYNLAKVLVTPSFYEGFGFPALEAMACGTIPIVSDRSSLPEVVGDVGLLIDPDVPETIAEAIEKSLTDIEWYDKMRRAGIERAKQFRWEQTAAITLSVYQSVGQLL